MLQKEIQALNNISKKSHKLISKYKLKRLKKLNLSCCTICFETGPVEEFYKSPSRHKICHKLARKEYYKKNKEVQKLQVSEYQKANSKKCVEKTKRWEKKNPDLVNAYRNKAYLKRKSLGKKQLRKKWSELRPVDKVRNSIRARMRGVLKSTKKYHFNEYIGCTPEEFQRHLESQFSVGMTWDNYGKWHIDHIIPLSSVDLSNDVEFLKVTNYRNLQPLWAIDNYKKGKKLNYSISSVNQSINK